MFRALNLFPPGTTTAKMEPPLSVTLVDKGPFPPVDLVISPDAVFTTAVGKSSKRTLASWHVTAPQEVIDHMLEIIPNGGEENGADAKSNL
jgi:trehalose 6-phosphate synthase/phosphatase